MVGARDHDFAGLDRLPERIQDLRLKFGKLVEKENAEMRERNLAGTRAQAPADHRRGARRMVRIAERPPVRERAILDHAGDGGDHRGFEKLARRKRRQDRGQPRRQHRFAGAGRPDHENIVGAGRGDLQRALGAFLSFHFGKIERRFAHLANFRRGPRQHLRAAKMVRELNERGGREDFHLRTCPGGLGPAGGGTNQAVALRVRGDGGGQHARDRRERAVEAKLADDGEALHRIRGDRADRRHQAERDRQIVMTAFLRQIRGREIDGDSPRRQRQPRGDQSGAHPVLGFGNGLIRETDNGEGGQARRHLRLHVDRLGLDPFEGDRRDVLDHRDPQIPARS